MDELTSLGLILLLALLAGHLVKVVKIPEVTGYILAGIALGPSVLGWVSAENLSALEIISEVALGLILFSIGSVFKFSRFRHAGRQVLFLTLSESILASVLVIVGILVLGQPWQVALLLGAVAIATAPASTLMVIRECDSAGPLTENISGIVAVNNLFCITTYALVAATIDLASGLRGHVAVRCRVSGRLPSRLAAHGVGGAGLPGRPDAGRVVESGDRVWRGADPARRVDPAVCQSRASSRPLPSRREPGGRCDHGESGRAQPTAFRNAPIFFVIAGADLDLTLIPTMGVIGLVYVGGRAIGKFVGAIAGAHWLQLRPTVQRFLGFSLMAQAGLAVGLTIAINQRFETFAPIVSTVVLASVAIFEIIGPISTRTRFALVHSGEAGLQSPDASIKA